MQFLGTFHEVDLYSYYFHDSETSKLIYSNETMT